MKVRKNMKARNTRKKIRARKVRKASKKLKVRKTLKKIKVGFGEILSFCIFFSWISMYFDKSKFELPR